MINLSRLYLGTAQPADGLRYGEGHRPFRHAAERRPVVVWNITRRCNLHCVHCYSDSDCRKYDGELSLAECRSVIDDLAEFRIPALLLSGGEPLAHPDFFAIAAHTAERGIPFTVSTNGTLLGQEEAFRLKMLGCRYVGISLDGIGETHDRFRGRVGAFALAVRAFRNCRLAGLKAGLRLTLSRHTIDGLEGVLQFIEEEGIERVCFYHLVFSGRGSSLAAVEPERVRQALDTILDRIRSWHERGITREVLTVDLPADGPHLYLRLKAENPTRAADALRLLQWNGGGTNGSGIGLGNIDSQGNVHPDQFWQTHTIDNVRRRPFSEIWTNSGDELLAGLRDRLGRIHGRCQRCRFLSLCGGGFRVRALQVHGDPWASDPACYLSDEEILAA
ncbi:MAG TPA: radical SAM protein [Terrimicrobiaceae bacterium]|nr:radical SAM protein [Terrimicrobiaceae bacterium]